MNETRQTLHRIATHVLARARHEATGRIGLRATAAGFGTPAYGESVEVVRVAGGLLVRERDGRAAAMRVDGATLHQLAAFVETDLSSPFSAGDDTPPLGDPDAPLRIDTGDALLLAGWFDLGWRALDTVVADHVDAKAIQLWPEHFDAGTSVAVGPGENDRCNLGVSPGDSYLDEPYLYIGPWSDERPGDPSFWNAPFGAVLRRSEVDMTTPVAASVAFLQQGLERLRGMSL